MKKFLSVLAIAAGLQFGLVQAAQAVDSANLPAFQQKLYANGEPIKAKPLVLRDFIELRSARGFSKAVLEDLNGKKYALNGFTDKLVMIDIWASGRRGASPASVRFLRSKSFRSASTTTRAACGLFPFQSTRKKATWSTSLKIMI